MYLGEKEIKECPHRTVSRSYDSPPSAIPQWKCDWCGQDFTKVQVESRSKTVELSEVERELVPGRDIPSIDSDQSGTEGNFAPPSLPRKRRIQNAS